MDSFGLSGSDYTEDAPVEPDQEQPRRRGGMSDPEVRARALETRRANAEARRAADPPDAAERPRGPGRPPKATAPKSQSTQSLELLLMGIHSALGMIAASVTGKEFWKEILSIDQQEARILAQGFDGVMREFKVKLDGKTAAVASLINAMGMVYGPRAIALYMAGQRERTNPNA